MAPNFLDMIAAGGGSKSSTPTPVPAASGSGGTNFLDMMSGAGGGTASAGGSEAPNAIAQTALNKDLAFVQRSGNKKQIATANAVATGKSNSSGGFLSRVENDVSNPLTKALSALDYPRAVVASGVGQLLNPGEKNAPANHTGQSSWQQFTKDVSSHATFGHILAEHAEPPAQANSTAGHWINRVTGIVGDAALDPLNYLGGLGEASKAAAGVTGALALGQKADQAEKVAAMSKDAGDVERAVTARAAATKANPGGVINPDTYGNLTKYGVAGLSDEEKAAVGVQSGIGIGAAGHRIPLVPGAVTDGASSALHQLGLAGRTRLAEGSFAKRLIPHEAVRAQMREAAKAGDWQQANHIATVLKAAPIANNVRQAFLNTHQPALKAALNIPEEDLPGLGHALEGMPSVVDPTAAHASLDAMHAAAQKEGVDIGHLDNYLPHTLTEAARNASKGANPRAAFNGELQRTLRPGSIFLGHTLQHGSIDEINDIAKAEHGSDAYDLFNTDTAGVLGSYMHGLASRVGQQAFANHLDDMGVTASGDAALTHPDWENAASSGAFADKVTPSYVRDALKNLADEKAASAAKRPTGMLKHYDSMMSLWKKYQLAMPGKAIRHTVASPAWSSYIGGVKIPEIAKGYKLWRAYQKGGLDALSGDDRERVEEFLRSGVGHGHSAADLHEDKPISKNPLSSNFAYFRANQEVQARAQDYSKFAMYNDARNKGMDALDAAAKTRSLMGDPHNLTDFEKNVARRVVPFYGFLRNQMPAQFKAMAHTPGKFENFINAERDMQEGTPADNGPEPSFYKQTMSFRLPWKSNGNSQYLSPDLPFTRINQLFSGGNQLLAQMAPEIQLPLEHEFGGVNASTGAPFSKTPQNLPGIMNTLHMGPVLAALGMATKTKADQSDYGQTTNKGTYRMSAEALQALDSILPPVSQARRIDTAGEPNLQQRAGTTQLSDLVGQNFRTNDPYQQASEDYRRDAILKKMVEAMQANAQLPAYLAGFKK